MLTVEYKCDNCQKKLNYSEVLEIKSENKTLYVKNNLEDKKLISLQNFDSIHFCSKRCFVNYFFEENPQKQIK